MNFNLLNKYRNYFRKGVKKSLLFFTACSLFVQAPLTVCATNLQEEFEYRKTLPVASNEIANWPDGPLIGAQSAIVMEANTGTILYNKNIHDELYPASTTKIMSCLLAIENNSLDEIVTFSKEAVFGIERDSSNVGIDVGEQMTLEECLYIILLESANEVTAGVGEHVAGSIDAFVEMMNKRAQELGCLNTHFTNTNGLPDEQHYTSAYDLALIAQEFFKNETLSKMSGTSYYPVRATATQPDDFDCYNHHKMCKGFAYEYDGFIGGKTGYTNAARQTLVSCAERNGMKLICVVMKEEAPNQLKDTAALFDYGFNNFSRLNVAENDTKYTLENTDFFNTDSDIFGSSKQIISVNPNDYIILPNTADFKDTTSELVYDETSDENIASIVYKYNDVPIGSAGVQLASDIGEKYDFDGPVIERQTPEKDKTLQPNVIFINILKVLGIILLTAALFIAALFIRAYMMGFHFGRGRRRRRRNVKSDLKVRKRKGAYVHSPYRKKRRRDDDLHF